MPTTRRPKPLYQRGQYRLYARPGRNHEIVWYDADAGRERSASAGTTETEAAKAALDARYLEITRGLECCPTCNRPFDDKRGRLVTQAIELARHEAVGKDSETAINSRLDHVIDYIDTLPSPAIYCSSVNEPWIRRFRSWLGERPYLAPNGVEKQRSESTVENSVLQLAAAIRGIGEKPAFAVRPPNLVNRSPRYRADIDKIAAMLRYCLDPKPGRYGTDKERQRRIRERRHLLAFIRASIVTLARPDAVHDISTAPERGQWMANAQVLDLNPKGRPQTKKFRPTVPIARQALWLFDECEGWLIPTDSVANAWWSMSIELELPGDGEAGTKLIRRSMAKLLRDRLPRADWIEIEMFLGHRRFDTTSDIYAPFDPSYLGHAKAEIETIIDELEALVPSAFYRDFTAQGGNVTSIARAK